MSTPRRVLVAGAGAIGQWLGVKLAQAGHDVTLLARGEHAAAMAVGLEVRGLTTFKGPLRAVSDARSAGDGFDAVLLTSKAHQTAALAPQVAPCLAAHGVFVTMQNGFGNAQKIQRFVPAERVAIALTSHGVTLDAPGRLHHAGDGPTLIGPIPGMDPTAARTALVLLRDAGLDPEWQASMRPYVWRKAIVNAGINPVGALSGLRNGDLLARAEQRALCEALVREATALATTARVGLPAGDLVEATLATLERTRGNACSMLQDVQRKRPTEVEQITGRMVRLAEKLLVAMPRNESLYGRIKDLEASYLGAEAATRMAWDELPWEAEPF